VYRFRADLAGPRRGRRGGPVVLGRPRSCRSRTTRARRGGSVSNTGSKRSKAGGAPPAAERRRPGPAPARACLASAAAAWTRGLGWVVARVAHATPFGIVIGVLVGPGAGLFGAVRAADRASKQQASAKADRPKEN